MDSVPTTPVGSIATPRSRKSQKTAGVARESIGSLLDNPEELHRSASQAFTSFDLDNDDKLTLEDIKSLMIEISRQFVIPEPNDEVVLYLFNKFDNNEHHAIYRADFKSFFKLLLCWIRDEYYPESMRFQRSFFIYTHKQPLEKVYQKEEKIGKGQFGVVYKVRERVTGLLRCCKAISKSRTNAPAEFVQNEINILKHLDHPNIVKLFECFEDSSHLYLIFELIEGQELLQVLLKRGREGKTMTERETAALLRPILSSVAHCHANRIMHKDLKPENIMLIGGEEGVKNGAIKIIDFGLAEIFTPGSSSTTAAGTPYYMAPEVFNHKFNYKCDVWSVGVLMYLLLTAHLPFDAPNKEEYIKVVNNNSVSFPKELFKNVSRQAQSLIKKLLNRDHNARPTAADVLKDPWFSNFRADETAYLSEEDSFNLSLNQIQSDSISSSNNVSPRNLDIKYTQPVLYHPGEATTTIAPSLNLDSLEMSPLSQCEPQSTRNSIPLLHLPIASLHQRRTSSLMSPPNSPTGAQAGQASPLKLLSKQGSKFLRFSRQSSFARICLNLVAMNLSLSSMKLAPSIFRTLDTDHDGLLSEEDLRVALLSLGVDETDVVRIVDALDADDSGEISYTEFMASLVDVEGEDFEKQLRTVFRQFDFNGDDYLTKDEFAHLLSSGGLAVDARRGKPLEKMMRALDKDGDGKISFEDFYEYVKEGASKASKKINENLGGHQTNNTTILIEDHNTNGSTGNNNASVLINTPKKPIQSPTSPSFPRTFSQ